MTLKIGQKNLNHILIESLRGKRMETALKGV